MPFTRLTARLTLIAMTANLTLRLRTNNVIYILNVNVTTCRVNDVNTMTANAMKSRSNKSYYASSIVHEDESQVKMLPIS